VPGPAGFGSVEVRSIKCWRTRFTWVRSVTNESAIQVSTWLSFLLGMIGLVFVSSNINQFARRSASPGSLYTYIVRGLGPTAGVLGGWALLFGYMLTGISTLCGFGIIAGVLLGQIEIHPHMVTLFAIGTIAAFCIAYRDIQLSVKMMLVFEGAALIAILILGILIWEHKGFAVDTSQLTLTGTKPGGVLMGIVLVVFGFSGFESSTALGEEAKDPLRTIPRSVIQSVVVTGLVFIFMAYVVILGFKGSPAALATTEAPLNFLANAIGWGVLGLLINIGVLLSFFSCTLACINSTARIVFSTSRHGLFFEALGEAHEKNETPYIAVGLAALITFVIPAGFYLFGVSAFDGQGYFGTLSSMGFLVVYVLIDCRSDVSPKPRQVEQSGGALFHFGRRLHDTALSRDGWRTGQYAVPRSCVPEQHSRLAVSCLYGDWPCVAAFSESVPSQNDAYHESRDRKRRASIRQCGECFQEVRPVTQGETTQLSGRR
jgi:amino acid transporter